MTTNLHIPTTSKLPSNDAFAETRAPLLQQEDAIIMAVGRCEKLGRMVSRILGAQEGAIEISRFADGESKLCVNSNVREKDVYLIASTSDPANDSIMDLCMSLDALKKASARRVTVLMPYFGYARQDRRVSGREPITAQLVARLIETSGADRVVLLDVHAEQIQGFFRIPVDNVYGTHVLVPALRKELNDSGISLDDVTVVSPDAGGTKRARAMAKSLDGVPLALIDKDRPRPNEVGGMELLGDVKGKVCVIVDDMVDTGGTLIKAAALLKENGATRVIACITHPVLSGDAINRIADSAIDLFLTTDSIPLRGNKGETFKVVPTAELFSEVILRMSSGDSLADYRMLQSKGMSN